MIIYHFKHIRTYNTYNIYINNVDVYSLCFCNSITTLWILSLLCTLMCTYKGYNLITNNHLELYIMVCVCVCGLLIIKTYFESLSIINHLVLKRLVTNCFLSHVLFRYLLFINYSSFAKPLRISSNLSLVYTHFIL